MSGKPKFHIMSGRDEKDCLWLCSVETLAAATEEMNKVAADKPGKYFIFDLSSNTIVAQVDTSNQ
jgi:hypothetical protein